MEYLLKNSLNDIDNKINQAKKISIKEGSSYSLMEGFGLKYITPYAIAIGSSNLIIGLLSSLPNLIGNFMQLGCLKLIKKHSRKKIVFTSVFIQALLWIPVILTGILFFYYKLNSRISSLILIFSYTLLIGIGSIPGPHWTSWMKDLITNDSGKYFGKRNRITGIVSIISLIFAGIILNLFNKNESIGFIIILSIAMIGRFLSAYCFTLKYEPEFKYDESYYFSFIEFIKKMKSNNFGKFVIFISLISFSTAIASPFFSVYMIKNLKFSYIEYMAIILSPMISTIIFMPFFGRIGDKYGNIKVLKLTGFFIPFIPLLWLISSFIPFSQKYQLLIFLFAVEFFSGLIWAGFNLSSANFIYDAVSRQRVFLCVAYFNLINNFGIFIGSAIGGIIANYNHPIFGYVSIFYVFLISSILRFIFYMFGNNINEVRIVEKMKIKEYVNIKTKKIKECLF